MQTLLHKLKVLKVIALGATLFTSSAVNAGGIFGDRVYAGFGLSESSLNINNDNTIAVNGLEEQSVFNDDGFGLTAFAGYKLDEYLALELGYSALGSVRLTDSAGENNFLDVQSVYLDAILSYQVIKNLDAFALIGVSSWELNGNNSATTFDGNDFRYGAGLDVNLYGNNDRVLRLKWVHQEFDDLILSDSDTVSVSILFKF